MAERFVAIQVGAVSFVDEGVSQVLDTLQEKGGVNALFLATPTWTRGTGGRQIPGAPLPDHGVQEHDLDWRGGNYATVHPQFYGGTVLGAAGRAPEHPGWDIFEAVLPEARRRGMKNIAWIEESSYAQELRNYANFPKCLEVDPFGRPVRTFCFNNPDYRLWHLSIIEDYAKSYDLDGIAVVLGAPWPAEPAHAGKHRPLRHHLLLPPLPGQSREARHRRAPSHRRLSQGHRLERERRRRQSPVRWRVRQLLAPLAAVP